MATDGDRKFPMARAPGRFGTKPEGEDELDLAGVVETALARTLLPAAEAGRWGIVEQIAAELRAAGRAA
jgi:hypothetical protein